MPEQESGEREDVEQDQLRVRNAGHGHGVRQDAFGQW